MKSLRFFLIPAVLFLLPGLASAGWVSQSSGTTRYLYSVHFPVDAQTGYAVGDLGTILKTTDGGANWVSQSSGTTNNLYSVHFPVDAQTGYAAEWYGTIVKTTDGGVNWVCQPSGTTNYLYSVTFPVDASTGYVVGEGGTILKTTNGGSSFVEQTIEVKGKGLDLGLKVAPNPFTSFATVPDHSSDRFTLYDVSGRRVGVYKGDRIGEGLRAGVYFMRAESGKGKPVRVVKVR